MLAPVSGHGVFFALTADLYSQTTMRMEGIAANMCGSPSWFRLIWLVGACLVAIWHGAIRKFGFGLFCRGRNGSGHVSIYSVIQIAVNVFLRKTDFFGDSVGMADPRNSIDESECRVSVLELDLPGLSDPLIDQRINEFVVMGY